MAEGSLPRACRGAVPPGPHRAVHKRAARRPPPGPPLHRGPHLHVERLLLLGTGRLPLAVGGRLRPRAVRPVAPGGRAARQAAARVLDARACPGAAQQAAGPGQPSRRHGGAPGGQGSRLEGPNGGRHGVSVPCAAAALRLRVNQVSWNADCACRNGQLPRGAAAGTSWRPELLMQAQPRTGTTRPRPLRAASCVKEESKQPCG